MRIRIFKNFDSELKSLWLGLESRTKTYIFQRYIWLYHWQETIGEHSPRTEPRIVLLEDSDGAQAILPFGVQLRHGMRLLSFLGGDQSDYNCLVFTRKGKAMFQKSDLWEKIFSKLPKFDLLYINNIPEEITTSSMFTYHKEHLLESNHSYSAELPSSWEEYQKQLTSKLKADSRRNRRNLHEKGELKFEILEQDNEKISEVLEKFFEQKRNRYQTSGAYDMLSSEAVREFYSEMPSEFGQGAKIQLSALVLDDLVLATHWGVVDQCNFYYLMPTYSSKWKRYSPGRLLLEHLLKWSIEQNLKVFDFTVGGEEYKKEWCNREMKLLEVLHARTLKGNLYVYALMAKRALKKSQMIVNGVRKARKLLNALSTKIRRK
jgi:CelD/BcsL family acetyltransferase involved in cellulose biosynthesis